MAEQSSSELVLIIIPESPVKPLCHRFCRVCHDLDKAAGVKETPLCGTKKIGPWKISPNHGEMCVVCMDLDQRPCERCRKEGRA